MREKAGVVEWERERKSERKIEREREREREREVREKSALECERGKHRQVSGKSFGHSNSVTLQGRSLYINITYSNNTIIPISNISGSGTDLS